MNIAVVSSAEAGSLMAHAINTVKMAEGFAQNGHTVKIICYRNRQNPYTEDDLNHIYGVKSLKWRMIPQIPTRASTPRQHKGFATLTLPFLLFDRPDFVFARNYIVPIWASRLGIPTVGETHAHIDNTSSPFLSMLKATHHHKFLSLITISPVLKDYYVSQGAVDEKIMILPTGVNIDHFICPDNLPPTPYTHPGPHIVYAGHLYDYKGIPTILDVAGQLPHLQFHFVGGHEKDITQQQNNSQAMRLTNVHFHGMKSQNELPRYLWHADVLLLPPSANHPSAKWTSPVKLGEYLASGTPIVATEISALQYWLDDEVYFVTPDNGNSLAEGVLHILTNVDQYQKQISKRVSKAKEFAYHKRTQTILEFIG